MDKDDDAGTLNDVVDAIYAVAYETHEQNQILKEICDILKTGLTKQIVVLKKD